MTRPAILTEIDALLETHLASGIRATAESHVLSDVQDHLGISGSRVTIYKGVNITRSLAQIVDGGFAVRAVPGSEKPDEQPRDPETGRFLSYEDGA